jgi:hypothetical protein
VARTPSVTFRTIAAFQFRRLPWLPTVAATSLICIELVPRLSAAGAPFDEGFALTYGDRVLHGAVPGRDFMTFYGPLNPAVFAGLFATVGESLQTERVLGLAYRLTVVAGVLWLLRRQTLASIVSAILAFAVLFRHEALVASSSWGAVALLIVAIVLSDAERPTLAGAAAMGVVLMRVDYFAAAGGAVLPYAVSWNRERLKSFSASSLVGLALLAAWLMLIGPDKLRRLAAQLQISEAARRLPLPSVLSFPGNALVVACGTIGLLLVLGWCSRGEREGRLYMALGLVGVGLLPSTLQRPDAQHIVLFAALTAPFCPAVLSRTHQSLAELTTIPVWLRLPLAKGFWVIPVGFVVANLLVGPVLPHLADTKSYAVRVDGRSFRLRDAKLAAAFQAGLARLNSIARPGQTVFVGPQDLRRTNVNDAFVYFMLPRLRPSSYYIELDPHVTAVKGSEFLDQLARADFLVLSSDADKRLEPNTSRVYDSGAANSLVRDRFCLRGIFGQVRVLQNCRGLRRSGSATSRT